jgi:hypothetical protein
MRAKTQKEIALKDGSTLPKGLPVSFIEGKDSRCLVHSPNHSEPLQVRITSAFKAPSMSSWNAGLMIACARLPRASVWSRMDMAQMVALRGCWSLA